MPGRPGLVQKRLSPHRFVQLPDRDKDRDRDKERDKNGMGRDREFDDVAIDIPLTSPCPRKYYTGARKGSSNSSATAAPYCRGAAYGPPILFSNGVPTEKTGLVDAYGTPTRRSRLTRRRSSADDSEDTAAMGEPRPGRTMRRLARMYERVLNYSTVTRYAIYILPVAAVIAVPIILGATVARDADIGGIKLCWFFAWIEVTWMGLWVSKVVAHVMPSVFRFLGGIANVRTGRQTRFLRQLEMPISLVCWVVVGLVTFFPIMNLNPVSKAQDDTAVKPWQTSVKNLLFALLVCSLMFLAEKALVRSVLLTYRRTQFEAKVTESARVVELLSSLYEASCMMFPVYCREFRNDDAIMADSVREPAPADGNRVRSMKNLKYFKDLVPGATGEAPASGGSAHEFTRHAVGWNSARSVVIQALGRKRATEALARRIWMSFVVEGHHALYLEDVIEVLGSERDVEAQEYFRMLDRDGNGDISLDEMVLTVAEFGQMRTSLLHSVHDVDQATRVLDRIFVVVALILGSLVSVFFVTNTSTTAITAGATALLGLCFLLSATAHEVLGSCVFLFVKRPFEVGDRVEVEEKSYIVQRISLLYTVFRCVADHRTTQAANNVLNNHWIDNFTRASAMREQLTVPANFETTFDDIQKLREELERFVRDKENCRDFMPDIDIEVAGLGNMDRLELCVDIRHKYNWSNESVRAARRSKFMCALVLALRRIGIRPPGEDETASEKLFGPASADQHEEARGLLSGEVDGPQASGIDSENQPSARRRGPSHASAEHLNPPSPGPDDEVTRYQTPSASPNKRLSENLNPGMTATSRQSSTGRRKATRSAEGISSGVPIIAEPAPLQRPPAPPSLNYNLHSSYVSEHQRQRRFSYDAVQPRSFGQMEQCTSPVAGLFSSPGQQRGIRGD